MKNILFCNVSMVVNKVNLPYNWACLKTYCEEFEIISNNYKWLDPIFTGNVTKQVIEVLKEYKIDILCLSCYTWNHDKNYNIAILVKSIYPDCLIVMGGPEPDYNDFNYFRKYPLVDVIVKNEGENAFKDLLESHFYNKELNTSGLVIPIGYERNSYDTGDSIKISNFDISPYLAQKETFEKIINDYQFDKTSLFADMNIVWETSRGCPYRCSYCKWDFTSTSNSIRKIPMERLQEEIKWFNSIDKNFFLQLLDSNFGIFDRDLEIIEYFCDNFNNPKLSFLHASFDQKEVYGNKIINLLHKNKLIRTKNIGIQHTDPDVLKEMNRYSIDLTRIANPGTPNMAHVILGGPQDTPTKWAKCLTDLIEVGIQEFILYKYHVFNNSRSSTPEFIERNKVVTIDRYFQNFNREKTIYLNHNPDTKLIVATSTYDKLDYVNMSLYGAMISTFHTGGFMKSVSEYLVNEGITTYYNFYDSLFKLLIEDNNNFTNNIVQTCKKQMLKFVNEDYSLEELEIKEIPNFPYLYKIEEYMLFKYLYEYDKTWEILTQWIFETFGQTELIEDLLKYQKQLMITLEYNYDNGLYFNTKYDWKNYFENGELNKSLTEYHIVDKRCGWGILMCWNDFENEERIQKYINTVIGPSYKRYNRSVLQEINYV